MIREPRRRRGLWGGSIPLAGVAALEAVGEDLRVQREEGHVQGLVDLEQVEGVGGPFERRVGVEPEAEQRPPAQGVGVSAHVRRRPRRSRSVFPRMDCPPGGNQCASTVWRSGTQSASAANKRGRYPKSVEVGLVDSQFGATSIRQQLPRVRTG